MGLLEGKLGIVTGAARGIGKATAQALCAEGARVLLVDSGCDLEGHNPEAGLVETVRDELRAQGADVEACAVDVCASDAPERMMASALAFLGGVELFVHCAGIQRERSVFKLSHEDFQAVHEVVAMAGFRLSQAVVRQMVQQKRGGRLVLVSSPAGLQGHIGQLAQASAHASVAGMTRTMAVELKKHQIRVNAIVPLARTRMTEGWPMFQALTEQSYGPQFVAPIVVFLGSELAGDINGELVGVAGSKVSVFRVEESQGVLGEQPRVPWDPRELQRRWSDLARRS